MPAVSKTQSELSLINNTNENVNVVEYKQSANNLALNLLRHYFNFAYIFLLSPFRLVETFSDKCKIGKVAWLPQNILCGIFHTFGVLWLVKCIRENVPQNKHNPAEYFVELLQIINLISVLLALKKFWINQSSFLKLANFIKSLEQNEIACDFDNYGAEIVFLWKWGWKFVFVLCSALIFVLMGFGEDYLGYGIFGNADIWLQKLLEETRFTFFLTQQNGTKEDPETYLTTDYLLIVVGGIGLFQKCAWGISCLLFLLVFGMILWITSYSFMESLEYADKERYQEEESNVITITFQRVNDKQLKTCNKMKWKETPENGFKYLEQLSKFVNDIIGNSATLFIFQCILYYSTCYLEISAESKNKIDVLKRYAIFVVISFGASMILRFWANIPFMVYVLHENL